jgi:hypothetical protein
MSFVFLISIIREHSRNYDAFPLIKLRPSKRSHEYWKSEQQLYTVERLMYDYGSPPGAGEVILRVGGAL